MLRQDTVRARKHYKCFLCEQIIEKGVLHDIQVGSYEGSIYTLRFHLDCLEIAHKLNMFDEDEIDSYSFMEYIDNEYFNLFLTKEATRLEKLSEVIKFHKQNGQQTTPEK